MGLFDEFKDAFHQGEQDANNVFDKLEGKKNKNAENANEPAQNAVNNAATDDDGKQYIDANIMPDLKKLGGKLTGFIKKKLS